MTTRYKRTNLVRYYYFFKIAQILIDFASLWVAFFGAYAIRRWFDPFEYFQLFPVPPLVFSANDYIRFSIPIIFLWQAVFLTTGLYFSNTTRSFSQDCGKVIASVNSGLVIFMVVTFFRGSQFFSRLIIFYAWFLAIVALITGRIFLILIRKLIARYGKGVKRILIMGDDDATMQVIEGFRHKRRDTEKVVGILLRKPEGKSKISNFSVLGAIEEYPKLLKKHGVDEAILALSSLSSDQIIMFITFCDEHNIIYKFIPDMFHLLSSYTTVNTMNGLPLITLRRLPLQGWRIFVKRFFDIATSFFGLVLLSPFLIGVALLVKLTSRGPIFVRQPRIGMDGGEFTVYKFRSMCQDADGKGGRFWTVDNDPRITPVGKWLRTLNIDELPQLWNVLKGDMSLVGPRPEQPRFVDQFKNSVHRYMDRHRVKTGITGWAQVNALRGDSSIEERVKFDIYYIENWSLWFDIQIIFRTFISFGK